MLKILIGCEESQAVCKAFRGLGHEAYSCDLLECSGGHPEWHIIADVVDTIISKTGITQAWNTIEVDRWDLIILHPPCTAMAVSGNRWYGSSAPWDMRKKRMEAIEWTRELWVSACDNANHVALENPVGVLTLPGIPVVDPAYIQPWQFGHGETKKTGFWLRNLPKLVPTDIVDGREQRIWEMPPSVDRSKMRSKTYPGIAKAMAKQWSDYVLYQSGQLCPGSHDMNHSYK